MRKFITVLLPVIFLSGCAAKGNGLAGQWVFADKGLGPLVLTFSEDGRFLVDADSDGNKDIWGRYDLYGERIEFIDDMPWIISDCNEPGFHFYRIDQGTLLFSEFADSCRPRKDVLKRPMVRKRRNK